MYYHSYEIGVRHCTERDRAHLAGLHAIKGAVVGQDHEGVADEEHDDHKPHEQGREGSERPNDGHSWLHHIQNRKRPFPQNPHSEVPKLQHSDRHVEAEQVEALLVANSDTSLRPYAVMIEFVDADPTRAAMRNS